MRVLAAATALVVLVAAAWWIGAKRGVTIPAAHVAPNERRQPNAVLDSASQNTPAAQPGESDRAPAAVVDDPATIVVECVRDADGMPVPFARVWIVPPTPDGLGASEDDVRAALARDAPHTADAAGRVSLPKWDDDAHVIATADGLYGNLRDWWGREPPLRLRLVRDTGALRVRVLDGAGQPVARAPVALLGRDVRTYPILRQHTDEQGVATFPHARARFATLPVPHARALVGLELVGAAPAEREVDLEAPLAAPIELVAPPFGSLELTLVDWDGAPLEPPLGRYEFLEARWSGAEFDEPGVRIARPRNPFVFDAVAVGVDVQVALGQVDFSDFKVLTVAGPRAAGERVAARFAREPVRTAYGDKRPFITGRLLDPDGAPIALAECVITVDIGMSQMTCTTRADGKFDAIPSATWAGVKGLLPPNCVLAFDVLTADPPADASARVRYRTRVQLSAATDRDVVELGDVRVTERAEESVVVAGTVTDARGRPQRASVFVWTSVAEPRDDPKRVQADALGRFRVFGPKVSDDIEVSAQRLHDTPRSGNRVPFGTRDVVLVLERTRLAGRVLLEEGIDARQLRLRILPDHYAKPEADGSFEFDWLTPALSRLRVEGTLFDEPVVEVDGIELLAGELTRAPQVDPLDLRGKLFAWNLSIEDRDGGRVLRGKFLLRALDRPDVAPKQMTFGFGGVNLLLARPNYELVLAPDGYERVKLAREAAEQRVELRRVPQLELTVPGGLPSEPSQAQLLVSLRPAKLDGADAEFAAVAGTITRSAPARLDAPCVGRVRAEFVLQGISDTRGVLELKPFEPELFEVPEAGTGAGAALVRYELQIDRAAVEAAFRDALK